jgi:GGDEF domain-containing protein
VVLLNNVDLPLHATHVAVKIRDALSSPYQLGDQALFSMPSIGIALYPEHGGSMEALLQHADSAMYSSKKVTG